MNGYRVVPLERGPLKKPVKKKRATHRHVDDKYRAIIKKAPCVGCGQSATEAHHLTLDRYRMGRRSDDTLCVPICNLCHYQLHHGTGGERGFWNARGLSGHDVAERLYAIWRDTPEMFLEQAIKQLRLLFLLGQETLKMDLNIHKEKRACTN